MRPTDCFTLWIGDRLGPVERACLRSVARQGHRVGLYCYSEPEGVPDEVEVRDASAILPYETVTAPWVNRPDLYSDWFRYELLRRRLGTWVDTDVYLLSPLDTESDYLFGIEDEPATLNNAVFRVPADSELLPRLLEPFVKRTTPKTMPWRLYAPKRLRELLTGEVDLTNVPWGTTSPKALTVLARELGLVQFAQPKERFYPVRWQEARWILDPNMALEDVTTDHTVAVHLWNYCISDFKNGAAPSGSFLDRLQKEGA
ncbi:MAG TPA: hypothetical protein VFI88_01120 [Sphingomicrobium sp.]|nr:hypothetical protein [Sphingomicrobium sp.]